MTVSQINHILEQNNYLLPGVPALMDFFHQKGIITILASGNIVPVLEYYQKLLGITHVVGPQPDMDGEVLAGITESAFPSKAFKVDKISEILRNYNVSKENIIALGDSPADKGMFAMSSFAIAVNPKGDIAESADAVIGADLNEAVSILNK